MQLNKLFLYLNIINLFFDKMAHKNDNERDEKHAQRFGLITLLLLFIYLIAGKPILKAIGIFTDAIANFLQTIF